MLCSPSPSRGLGRPPTHSSLEEFSPAADRLGNLPTSSWAYSNARQATGPLSELELAQASRPGVRERRSADCHGERWREGYLADLE